MKRVTKNHAVSKEVVEVTQVLEKCLTLNTGDQEKYLAGIRKKSPGIYDQVETLLSAGDKKFVSDDKFISALIHVTKDTATTSEFPGKSKSTFEPYEAGKYAFLQELGRGGMAVVYRAKTRGVRGFEKSVAVKKILSEHMENQDIKDLFEFEAHLSAILQHPNIVHVFDFFHKDGNFYLVMEFVHGKNLSQLLKRLEQNKITLPLDCCLHICCEVLKGLEYAHTRTDDKTGEPLNIIHRDICPRNVMVSYTGDIKIVDFGIAKTQDRVDITQTGSFRGTVSYMAPELLNGQKADAKSDIFSASLLLYELISGKTFFKSESLLASIDLVRKCEIKPQLDELKIDEELKSILRRGLEREPELRFQSADELLRELQNYLFSHYRLDSTKKLSFILKSLFKRDLEFETGEIDTAEQRIEENRNRPASQKTASFGLPVFRWDAFIFGALVFLAGGALMAKLLWKKQEVKPETIVEKKIEVPPVPVVVTKPEPIVPDIKPVPPTPKVVDIPKSKPTSPDVVAYLKRDNASVQGCSVLFNSKPSKAKLIINGTPRGVTPLVTDVECLKSQKIAVELPGYEKTEKTVIVKKSGSKMTLSLKKNE